MIGVRMNECSRSRAREGARVCECVSVSVDGPTRVENVHARRFRWDLQSGSGPGVLGREYIIL